MTYVVSIIFLLDSADLEENPSNMPLTNPQNSFPLLASQHDVSPPFYKDNVELNHIVGLFLIMVIHQGISMTSLCPP